MLQDFLAYNEQKKLLMPGDIVVAGVSGGADSVCLLALLDELKEKLGLTLYVIHVHHGIRGAEADRDAAFVRELAGKKNLPFCLVKKDVPAAAKELGMTEEEAGRRLRYEAMEEYAKKVGADKIALAHHRDDQAETVLFHLFRGSGPRGLRGMPVKRGPFIRPLLFVSRQEIEAYLAEKQLSYCEDSTNSSLKYSRNMLRRQILPLITKNINAQAAAHIAAMAERQEKWCLYIEKQGREAAGRLVRKEDNGYSLDTDGFLQEEEVVRDEVLRQVLEKMVTGAKDISAVHYEKIHSLCRAESGGRIQLPGETDVEKGYDRIYFYQREQKQEPAAQMTCQPGDVHKIGIKDVTYEVSFTLKNRLELPEKIPQKDYTKWFDYDMIVDSLFLRGPLEGDYFCMDQDGHKKKLSRYYIDKHIPRQQRSSQWVLADGSHVLWAIPGRISEYYKVTEKTSHVLVVSIAVCEYFGMEES